MSIYLSAEGLKALEQELEDRKTRIRREIAERISTAKDMGDLSENFEYGEAKDDQGSNEVRIANLEEMVKNAVVVKDRSGGSDIHLGTTFVAQSPAGKKQFSLVGSTEANPLEGKISNESALGTAFLGKSVGDVVAIAVPSGKVEYKIIEIK
ncbi:transcription elongation factor GreA [Candidatus Uhrbacteria bacterium]|nr:transcription elongation factor GreA [Candidatus Uhrbacteria bacterium]